MAPRKNMGRIEIYRRKESIVLNMGDIEIWDGADLSLLRDALVYVIDKKHAKSVAVDMTYVKYIPSGFFGMLYDWFEKDISMFLINPQDHVLNMLWFKRFFKEQQANWYKLSSGPNEPFMPDDYENDDEIPTPGMQEIPVAVPMAHLSARSL